MARRSTACQPPHTLVQVGAGTQDRGGPPTKEDLESSERGLVGPAAGGSPENSNLGWRQWHQVAPSVEASTDFWEKVDTAFEVRLGQVNEWTIPLPDELIAAVRALLKAAPHGQAKSDPTAAPGDKK